MICAPEFESVTTDALESRLVELEALVSRVRAAQVAVLRELDVRQVPMLDGCRSLAEWMVSRVDVSPETATAITKLVLSEPGPVDVALIAGEVSVDRAVELTRLDTSDPVSDTVHLSFPRLRHHIAMQRRHTRHDERRRHAERFLMMQLSLDQTGLRLSGELVGIDAARFQQVVSDAADQMPSLPSGTREPRNARMADALVNLITDAADVPTGDLVTCVSVLVDATHAAASNGESGVVTLSGVRIGPGALEAILCAGVVEVNARTADGRHVAIGNRTHTMSPRLRRLIHQRDAGMCTADGCHSRYRLQPHHIRHRADGGADDPANLTLLCWFHHHVVIHRNQHRIDPDSRPGRIRFLPPEPGVDPPI